MIESNKENLKKSLAENLAKLKQEKIELLKSYGYSLEDLKPIYKCNLCEDTGYIKKSNRQSIQCNCLKQRLLDESFSNSNLSTIKFENFDTFNEFLYSDEANEKLYNRKKSPRQNINTIKNNAFKFIENFDDINQKNLFFIGSPGLGKTFLSSCIAKELVQNGKTVLYQTAPILLDNLTFEKLNKSQSYQKTFKLLTEVDLLIIDDLGTELTNSMITTELLNLLNTRLVRNNTIPTKTIISSNYDLIDLGIKYSERFTSRIIGYFDVFRFYGNDLRHIKNMKKINI